MYIYKYLEYIYCVRVCITAMVNCDCLNYLVDYLKKENGCNEMSRNIKQYTHSGTPHPHQGLVKKLDLQPLPQLSHYN